MADRFDSQLDSLSQPAREAFAITPRAADETDPLPEAIHAGAGATDPVGLETGDITEATQESAASMSSCEPVCPAVCFTSNALAALDEDLQNKVISRTATDEDAPAITEALLEWLPDHDTVYFESGLWMLDQEIAFDRPMTIFGDGDNSELRWIMGSLSAGIVIDAGGNTTRTAVRNLRLTTEKAGVGTALTIDYSGSALVTNQRPRPRAVVQNVFCHGSTGNMATSGWLDGLHLVNAMNCYIAGFDFNGNLAAPYGPYNGGAGIRMTGESGTGFGPVENKLHHVQISGAGTALHVENHEGIYLSHFKFVNVNRGIVATGDPQNTPEPGYWFTDGHIAAFTQHIHLDNIEEYKIDGVLCYVAAAPVADMDAILLTGARGKGIITNCQFMWLVSTYLVQAIKVDGQSHIDIHDNVFELGSSCRAIDITSNAGYVDVGKNSYAGNFSRLRNASATTTVEEWHGYSGSLNDIAILSRRGVQNHFCALGAGDGPGGVSLIGAHCVTYSANIATGKQVLFAAGRRGMWERVYKDGVYASTWLRIDGSHDKDMLLKPAAALRQTFPRTLSADAAVALQSGRLLLTAIALWDGDVVNSIGFIARSQAVSPTGR